MREAVRLKPLHPPAFMIHADQDVWPNRLDLCVQAQQLIPVLPMPPKVNNTADQRVLEASAISLGEDWAFHVDDEGGVGGVGWFVIFHCSVFNSYISLCDMPKTHFQLIQEE
jgi:hypothetical protein